MNTIDLSDTTAWHGACALDHLGVIEAAGADAAAFLHGQLSQDTLQLQPGRPALAAYCSPKGRMLATMWAWRVDDERVWLVMDRSLLQQTLKRLSMFVLRAKCKLTDQSAALTVLGLALPATHAPADAASALPEGFAPLPGHASTAAGTQLACAVMPADAAATAVAALPALTAAQWDWLAVLTGVPHITAATADQFVPQMVNFEVLGGVNFRKGCYPGQEVVARSQYRGTLKRRLFLAQGHAPMQPGQEVFSAADPGQPAGMVVNAAASPAQADGSVLALIELKLAAQDAALHLGSDQGPALVLQPLPYEVRSDET